MVSVPTRSLPVLLLATLNVTVPLPEPLAPPVTVSHESFDAAVQLQPPEAVTVTVRPLADCFGSDRLVELSENEHPDA